MLRSEINALIRDAEAYFEAEHFRLPPFAFWNAEDWANPAGDISEIVDCGLGWDITDFGLGEYHTCGLLLFTMRNGRLANLKSGVGKTYCEKAIVLDPGQHCPAHHHWIKVEDIIVRGGGTMGVEVHNAAADGSFADTDVTLSLDGVRRRVPAGTTLELAPGGERHPRARVLPQAHRAARTGALRRGLGGQRRRERQPLPPAGGALPRGRGGRAAPPPPRRRLREPRPHRHRLTGSSPASSSTGRGRSPGRARVSGHR